MTGVFIVPAVVVEGVSRHAQHPGLLNQYVVEAFSGSIPVALIEHKRTRPIHCIIGGSVLMESATLAVLPLPLWDSDVMKTKRKLTLRNW